MKARKPCSWLGCTRVRSDRLYCSHHSFNTRAEAGICTARGCLDPATHRGLCKRHRDEDNRDRSKRRTKARPSRRPEQYEFKADERCALAVRMMLGKE